jgi:hypothetical protein
MVLPPYRVSIQVKTYAILKRLNHNKENTYHLNHHRQNFPDNLELAYDTMILFFYIPFINFWRTYTAPFFIIVGYFKRNISIT